ncbi:phosphatase PAP2 family protein [Bacillus testis]|uniref:phosphatase PAP2 family protein n=1 Tax=Bacillus testis TaxID=1622072 RepID=UPI00067EFE71|nr:phosphatase PAP2 family protein [Bacillus testis]
MKKGQKVLAGPKTYWTAGFILVLFVIYLFFMYGINAGLAFSWEKPIQAYFQSWDHGNWHVFFVYWTELGSTWMTRLAAAMLVIWLVWKKRDFIGGIACVVLVLANEQLNHFMKNLVARERPMVDPAIDAYGYSFPSGHAMASIVTYGVIAYFLAKYADRKQQRWLIWLGALVLIVSIGISRVVLSAHFPTDIIAGYCLGLSFLLLVLATYDSFVPPKADNPEKELE